MSQPSGIVLTVLIVKQQNEDQKLPLLQTAVGESFFDLDHIVAS